METRVDILRKYLSCFHDEDNKYWHMIENEMGNDLLKLGFVMDSFECYKNAGLPEELLRSKATLEQIRKTFEQSDYKTISASLFSMWRYLTHWLESDPRDYYNFCIAALERLIIIEGSAIYKKAKVVDVLSEISKIIIKGTSGWCIIDEAYHDKITVTADGISYEYKPSCETEINPSRKWTYKTTSPIFKKLYADLLELMPTIINRDPDLDCTDVGGIEFILTYSDGTKYKATFFQSGDEFKDCFCIIKQMVPECEYVPAVLLTEDDYEG